MLTKVDLKAIEDILDRKLGLRLEEFALNRIEPMIDKKIEGLAVMTARGFENVDKRFQKVDERFQGIDKRFEEFNRRFEEIDNSFDRLEYKVAQGFDILTDKLSLVSARVGI